jgi:hypothetical protein
MQESLAEKEVTAVIIRQGKRITIPTIQHPELSFVIYAPDIVRPITLPKWLGVRWGVPFPVSSFNKTFFLKDTSGSTGYRPADLGVMLLKSANDFLWSPGIVFEPGIYDSVNDFRWGRVRMSKRSTRAFFKVGETTFFVTCEPLVNSFTADIVVFVELGDGKLILKKITN